MLAAAVQARVILWHLGTLHPVEQVLTLVLAFGPFLVLGAVIAIRRRHDSEEAGTDVGSSSAAGQRDR